MANTYTQIHIQFVFAVKNRNAIIATNWKDELYKYITGTIQSYNHKVLAINGMPDHIHILVGFRPNQSMSELVQLVKQNSSKWINEKGFVKGRFEWQEGYGGFSYSKSQISSVATYIANQENHHAKFSFRDEYLNILKNLEIEFDEKYIFKELE